ncbi:hypothetical protein ELE36_19200 [Pseudolysobacter antarcticus]|uniref:Uncharacterized protein n=1 Tax=Pseudolysobacter antarcticus TaxID=2511995 RepID=A0A411HPB4_9GAMM|nr:hypothetical protein [Pseudolysobacter antarcticus]QBB72325.1 hypothetical protein ELE36_19200 [Pseudolysobacter antarcticus]
MHLVDGAAPSALVGQMTDGIEVNRDSAGRVSGATTTAPHSRQSRLRSLAAPFLLALACLLVYNANLRQIGAGDTLAARYLPLILWHDGSLELSAHTDLLAQGHPTDFKRYRPANADGKAVYFEPPTYWLVRTREHQLASFYPLVTPLLVAPLYVPAVLWLNAHGWEQSQVDRIAEWMEKLAASILAAAASVLVYLTLRREGNRWSLPLALVFAFGTNTWMISSQALWQHGTGELLVAAAILLVLGPATFMRLTLLGALCVLMTANRPPDALIAMALGLFIVCRRWRDAAWLIAGGVVPLAAMLVYNLNFMGHLAGGYGLVKPPDNFFQNDWSGLAGLLVSPARGLLVFSPFLVFAPIGLSQRLRSSESRVLVVALGLAVIAQLVLYAQGDWRAGTSWGPRWLTDLLPILMWMLAPAPLIMRPIARGLLVLAMVASVGVQTVGAFWYTKTSDELIYAGDPASMRGAWDPGNIPFVTELRHPPARGELLCDAMGSIDLIGQSLRPSADMRPELESGAVLEGWALACGRSPAQILLLVDGLIIGSTAEFLPRPDVDKAMHTSAPTGWRISASLWGVASGERVLQLAVRIEPRSDFRIVREQHVIVHPQAPAKTVAEPAQQPSTSELDAMAARAALVLREHQTAYGAWLTSHTTAPRYEASQPEMNTFVTSTLVDLLAPIARRQNVDTALQRARTHLAAQIEDNGLVRYHGLPDGPTIGTLGCAITPDSDDTALVWRIAGRGVDDPRQQRMLETLARYKDARGFYRTWLAARKNYQCIDPGSDPNPTDIAIQMHVYLILRVLDPPSARALCGALQRSFHDEDIWVYYAKSALIPYLRVAELQQLGCTLALPVERLALPAEGQEIWSEAARWLVESTALPNDAEARQEARRVLAQLGVDDFALIRRSPPLLYHNDLSATVRRFYWSEDVGYALWLRLYEVVGIDAEPHRQP